MAFADFDDSGARQGFVPGIVGVAWICRAHLSAARDRARLPTENAIREMQVMFGVDALTPGEGKPDPELFLVDVGPNRAKVFAIVRRATGATPKAAREMLDNLPAKIAEGWPMSFEIWQRELCDASAKIEIRWD